MLELKHKNSLEHASRLEERESDLKKEYAKLHDRYTELFKTHVDYMERTKLLMGSTHSQLNSTNSERLELNRTRLHPMFRSSGPVSYGFASLETSQMLDTETICSPNGSDASSGEFFFDYSFSYEHFANKCLIYSRIWTAIIAKRIWKYSNSRAFGRNWYSEANESSDLTASRSESSPTTTNHIDDWAINNEKWKTLSEHTLPRAIFPR